MPVNATAAAPPASLITLRRLVFTILFPPEDSPPRWAASLLRVIVGVRRQRAQVGPRNFPATAVKFSPGGRYKSVCGSSVNSSLARPTPRRAKRPTDTSVARSALRQRVGEIRRDQQRPVDRAAHRGDAAGLVDRRPDDREVQPVDAADIAVEHLADMQADIDRRGRPLLGPAPLVQLRARGGACPLRPRARARRRRPDRRRGRCASVPSPISFSTSPPASWIAVMTASA